MVYKWCIVPLCTNTSIKTPEKLFLSVPKDSKKRKKWLQISRRCQKSIIATSNVFMCEDHFNMEEDTVNYMQYKMGYSKNILLADGAMPSRFDCQQDRKRRLGDANSFKAAAAKRERKDLVRRCIKESYVPESNTETNQYVHEPEYGESSNTRDVGTMTDSILTSDKSVQVKTKVNKHHRSKCTQTRFAKSDISTSPFKFGSVCRYTSPFKIQRISDCQSSTFRAPKSRKIINFQEDEKSDSDASCFTEVTSLFVAPSSSSKVSDSDSNLSNSNIDIRKSLVFPRNVIF